jgi:hypothetical protein
LQNELEIIFQEKQNLEKDFLNLAENYENLKNQKMVEPEILEMKSKEIQELREENEKLRSMSFMENQKNNGRLD